MSKVNNTNNNNIIYNLTLKGKVEHIGNKTECALLELAYSMGFNYEKYRPNQRIHRIIHFNSTRKRMTTLYYNPNGN